MKLLEKILVPVKVSDVSNSQIQVAIELAKKFTSQLILLQVLPSEAKSEKVRSILQEYVDKDFETLLKQIDDNRIQAEKLIVFGNMFEQIIQVGEQYNVNLILIPDDFHLSSNHQAVDYLAEKLIRKSEKPVWVVKDTSAPTPKSIVCSVDFSESSGRALTNAIMIARVFGAKLYVINVFEPLEELYSLRYKIDYHEENLILEEENALNFKSFLSRFDFTDVAYESIVLKGKPHLEILNFVSQHKSDMLFMGATGKTFIQRLLLGSVTELIVRELPCSMVITKSENILNLKIDKDISDLEQAMSNAKRLEEAGFYDAAIAQVNIALKINDLHLPAIYSLVRLYNKTNKLELADSYNKKADDILKRLWNRKIELEIRKGID